MPYVPTSGGGTRTSLNTGYWEVKPFQEGMAGNPQVFPLASQGSRCNADCLVKRTRF